MDNKKQNTPKPLTAFKLAMMAVVAIDSLKNLPSNAQYGPSLLFYYCFVILIFFIPSALVCAEMATWMPHSGGAYIWIRKAFGKSSAFISVWMLWLMNITWAPTILTFILITGSYFISPDFFESHKVLLLISLMIIFWSSLAMIARGIKTSSYISVFCAILGVILPMALISSLSFFLVSQGKIDTSLLNSIKLPKVEFNFDQMRLLLPLLLSFMGVEMIGAHAGDVTQPKKNYPKALLIATLIIFFTVMPASLSIMLVIPNQEIALTSGVIESFYRFLDVLNFQELLPIIIIMVIIGSFGIFYNWLLTISKYLLIAAEDDLLPKFLRKTNKHNMPTNQLFIQGIIFSALITVLILMPSIEEAFWLLTAACAQFGLIYYLFLFAAAIRLRWTHPNVQRPFQFGKSKLPITIISSAAILICFLGVLFGFIPPNTSTRADSFRYILYLSIVIGLGLGFGFAIYKYQLFKSLDNDLSLKPNNFSGT